MLSPIACSRHWNKNKTSLTRLTSSAHLWHLWHPQPPVILLICQTGNSFYFLSVSEKKALRFTCLSLNCVCYKIPLRLFFQIPTVWGPWRVLDLPDRITYSHTHSNAKLFPHTIHCVKPPQKIKLWSLRPSYQVLYPCPKSLAATIDGGLTAKEAEQVSCLSSPPSIHITHTHTCRRTHSRPLQSVLSSYPDPQLPVLANRRRFKFHSVKKLAHCYSVTGRANDVRQWQRWTPLSLWCLVAIAGPLLRRHRNAGDWQRRWWQQRLCERLTASVKCPVCVCAGVCVPLQACFDTRHLLSDGKLHAWLRWTLMPALRPFCPRGSQRGAVLRNLSTTDTWVDGDLCLLSATFFFFFWVLSQGTLFGAEGTPILLFPALLLMDRPACGRHQYQDQPHDQQDHRNHLGLREIVVCVRHPGSSHSDHQRDDPKWKDATVPRLLHPSCGLWQPL